MEIENIFKHAVKNWMNKNAEYPFLINQKMLKLLSGETKRLMIDFANFKDETFKKELDAAHHQKRFDTMTETFLKYEAIGKRTNEEWFEMYIFSKTF